MVWRSIVAAIALGMTGLAGAAGTEGSWPLAAGDQGAWRYSTLNEINDGNVARLSVAFTFSTGYTRGHEGAPIVAEDTMFIVSPYPNVVYALDLTQPGAPVKWKFEPQPESASQGVACCDVVNRGAAYSDGRVFFNTLDAYTIALDAKTGKELWRQKLGDINRGETMTMAPLVVKDKVLVGNSGGEYGVRGWLTALDVRDGHIAWRAYSTGPDKDVLIGADFKPHYESERGTDLGQKTWPGDTWQRGGGTVWGWLSYDPKLDLLYYGTANPGPWNAEQRPGDNKWTAGVFARNPDTGQARWFYQYNPHDLYDYDGVNEHLVLDLTIDGRQRQVIAHPDRNGYFYVVDRGTGEVISAKPFVHVNTVEKVDLATGRPQYVDAKKPVVNKVIHDICPHAAGGKDWQPSSYSPQTGWVYIPHQNMCQDMEAVQANYIKGTPFVGANVRMYAGPGGHRGIFQAWDPVAGRTMWEIHENFPVWSGALSTAGNLVFYGTMDGWIKAVNARDGKALWKFKVGSGVIGQPVTYKGPDGHQYLAVIAGVGGWAGSIVAGELDARDATAANGFVQAMSDLPKATNKGGTLYVFRLP